MKPIFKISGLSSAANDRMLSISLNDNAGTEGDNVTITLDDRDYKLEFPPRGLKIQVYLGYEETGLVLMGEFEIDEVQHKESQAASMVIKANSQKHTNSEIKVPRTEFFDEMTISQIVGEIAGRNGYASDVGDVGDFYYDHIEYVGKSDIAFLTELAEKHDAYVKLQDGKLIFRARSDTLGLVTLERNTMQQWVGVGYKSVVASLSFTFNARQEYKSVRCCWRDRESNELRYTTIGEGEPVFDNMREFETKQAAEMHAGKKLKRLNRGEGRIDSLDVPGNPNVRAAMELALVGFRPEVCDKEWVIESCTHTFDSGGYRLSIQADLKK